MVRQKPTGNIVSDGFVVASQKPRIRLRWIITIFAVIILLLAGLAALIIQRHDAQLAEDKRIALKTDRLKYEAAITASDTQRGRRQYAAAVDTLQRYAGSALDNQRKAYTYAHIGAIYEVQQDNMKALAWYRKAEKTSDLEELGIDQGIARTSLALGDKQTALKYYKKALAIIKEKSTNDGQSLFGIDDITDMETTIKQVEAAP